MKEQIRPRKVGRDLYEFLGHKIFEQVGVGTTLQGGYCLDTFFVLEIEPNVRYEFLIDAVARIKERVVKGI